MENESTVEGASVVEVGVGDSAINFDELDAVVSKPDAKDEVKESLEEIKEDLKEVKKDVEAKDEEEPEEVEEQQEDPEVLAAKEKAKEALKKSDEEPVKEAKTYEVGEGEEKVSLKADQEIDVVVNGQKEKAKIQDLIDNYSGRTHLSREVNKLHDERKSFHEERATLQSSVDEIYKLVVTEQNPVAGLSYLAEILGANPNEIVKQITEQMEPIIQEQQTLSPEERRARELEQELAYERKKLERLNQTQAEQAAASEMQQRVEAVLKNTGMDQAKFAETYQYLAEQVPAEELTPELVGIYVEERETREAIGSMLGEVAPELDPTKQMDAVESLRKVMLEDAKLSLDDVRDIAVEVYGSKQAKNLAKKLKKSKPVQTAKAPVSQDDIWNFDQL